MSTFFDSACVLSIVVHVTSFWRVKPRISDQKSRIKILSYAKSRKPFGSSWFYANSEHGNVPTISYIMVSHGYNRIYRMTSCSGDTKVSVFTEMSNDTFWLLMKEGVLTWWNISILSYWMFNLISLKTHSSLNVTFTVPLHQNALDLFNKTLKLRKLCIKPFSTYPQTKRSLNYCFKFNSILYWQYRTTTMHIIYGNILQFPTNYVKMCYVNRFWISTVET